MSATELLSMPTRRNPWVVVIGYHTGETVATVYEDFKEMVTDEETGEVELQISEEASERALKAYVESLSDPNVSGRIIAEVHPVEVRVPVYSALMMGGKISYVEVELE